MKRKRTTRKQISSYLMFPLFVLPVLLSFIFSFPDFFKPIIHKSDAPQIVLAVSPVNPLNPAEEVEPIEYSDSSSSSQPASQEQRPKQSQSPQTSSSSSKESQTQHTEESSVPAKQEKAKKKKKKKKKNFLNIDEMSSYQVNRVTAAMTQQPKVTGGGGGMDESYTRTGEALAYLSGVLLYGRKLGR